MAAAGIVGFGPQAKFFTNDDCYRKKKLAVITTEQMLKDLG
jgi:hypothetical protein